MRGRRRQVALLANLESSVRPGDCAGSDRHDVGVIEPGNENRWPRPTQIPNQRYDRRYHPLGTQLDDRHIVQLGSRGAAIATHHELDGVPPPSDFGRQPGERSLHTATVERREKKRDRLCCHGSES